MNWGVKRVMEESQLTQDTHSGCIAKRTNGHGVGRAGTQRGSQGSVSSNQVDTVVLSEQLILDCQPAKFVGIKIRRPVMLAVLALLSEMMPNLCINLNLPMSQ